MEARCAFSLTLTKQKCEICCKEKLRQIEVRRSYWHLLVWHVTTQERWDHKFYSFKHFIVSGSHSRSFKYLLAKWIHNVL